MRFKAVHRHPRHLLRATGMMVVMISITHVASAKPFLSLSSSSLLPAPRETLADAPALLMVQHHDGDGEGGRTKNTHNSRRRRTITMISSIIPRGGDNPSKLSKNPPGYENPSRGVYHYYNRVTMEDDPNNNNTQTQPSAVSIVGMILSGLINLCSGAFVMSGYFGALSASWLVGKMHTYLPTLIEHQNQGPSKSSNNLLTGEYKWTTLSTIGYLLLHTTGVQSNNIFSRMMDGSFLTILWIYSNTIHPTLGGMIGCTNILLSLTSLTLGNSKLLYWIDDLKDVRFKKLAQYVEGEEAPYVMKRGQPQPPTVPVITSALRSPIRAFIANGMGSASFLLVFPQYYLGLYMLASILISRFGDGNNGVGVGGSFSNRLGGLFGKWMQWLSSGICINYNENGGGLLACGIDSTAAAAADVISESIGTASSESISSSSWNSKKISHRLVVLYWMIAVVKGNVLSAIFDREKS